MLGRTQLVVATDLFRVADRLPAHEEPQLRSGAEDFHELLSLWSQRSPVRSAVKAAVYLCLCLVLAAAILSFDQWLPILICQMLLGLLYAHGLELTHECLHHNMFERRRYNRIFGFVTGIPMLVSYTQYRHQHLHHHRFIGTDKDQELFNYEAASLRSPAAFAARAWNVMRIPTFFKTLFRMWRGDYPEVFATPAQRHDAWVEYVIIASLFAAALILTLLRVTDIFLLVWFIPWLVFGEPFHYLFELPEHVGCDKNDRDICVNTRTYRTNPVYCYIINGNNYHIEHHLYPHVAVHNLRHLCACLEFNGRRTVPSAFCAFKALFQGRQG